MAVLSERVRLGQALPCRSIFCGGRCRPCPHSGICDWIQRFLGTMGATSTHLRSPLVPPFPGLGLGPVSAAVPGAGAGSQGRCWPPFPGLGPMSAAVPGAGAGSQGRCRPPESGGVRKSGRSVDAWGDLHSSASCSSERFWASSCRGHDRANTVTQPVRPHIPEYIDGAARDAEP